MPTTDQGSATTTAQAAAGPGPSADRALAPDPDRTGVDHWQARLDRARATMHLHQQEA